MKRIYLSRFLVPFLYGCLAGALLYAPPAMSTDSASEGQKTKGQETPSNRFRPIEMFDLEFASDPEISPDGSRVVFVRNFNDIMKDRKRSNLWIVNLDGSELRLHPFEARSSGRYCHQQERAGGSQASDAAQ